MEVAGDHLIVNLTLTNTGDRALAPVKNRVLVSRVNALSPAASVSVEMPRTSLEQLALDPSILPAGVVTAGDAAAFDRFVALLDRFDPVSNIVTP